MPYRTFEIDTYRIMVGQFGPAASGTWRHVHLVATPATQSICVRASLFFFPGYSALPLGLQPGQLGKVTDVDQPGPLGQNCYGQLIKDEFGQWYDVLRNERPLTVTYGYDGQDGDPATPTRELLWIRLNSGAEEPPGEGPEGIPTAVVPPVP